MKYDINEVDGHVLLNLDEGAFIVDTGSQASFARGGRVSFGGASVALPTSAMGMLDADALSGYVGMRLDGLLGMDVLGRHRLTFLRRELLVGDGDLGSGSGGEAAGPQFQELETGEIMGIPFITVGVNNRKAKVFVDSGAKISYLDEELLSGCPVGETLHDFYPLLGEFDVDASNVQCTLAGRSFSAKFGRLPALLQMSLGMAGVDGILGHDLFDAYAIRIDRGGSPVSIMPHKEL